MESAGKSSSQHSLPVSLFIKRTPLISMLKLGSWTSCFPGIHPSPVWHRPLAELYRAYLGQTQGGYRLQGDLAFS